MRILLTNREMVGGTGTETLIRDLVMGLRRNGHTVVVYAPKAGRAAALLRATGTPVARSVLEIAGPPDIIHGHHTGPTMAALARFRNVPAIFVCHDFSSEYDDPPEHPRIRRYLYVRSSLQSRLCDERGIEPSRTTLWLNTIDLHRVGAPAPIPLTLRTAGIFARPDAIAQTEQIANICRSVGIAFKGPMISETMEDPLNAIKGIDLVFASGRMAIEALAAGHAVVLADRFGVGGLVTMEQLEHFGRLNFAIGGLSRHPSLSGLESELGAYDPDNAARVCQNIRSNWCVEKGVERLEQIYAEVLHEWSGDTVRSVDAESVATAKFIEKFVQDLRVYDRDFVNMRTGYSDLRASIENLTTTSIALTTEVRKLRRAGFVRRLWNEVLRRRRT
jgi:hypothetical protein